MHEIHSDAYLTFLVCYVRVPAGFWAKRVDSLIKSKGYSQKNWQKLKFPGADHYENARRKRLDIPIAYLPGKSPARPGESVRSISVFIPAFHFQILGGHFAETVYKGTG